MKYCEYMKYSQLFNNCERKRCAMRDLTGGYRYRLQFSSTGIIRDQTDKQRQLLADLSARIRAD